MGSLSVRGIIDRAGNLLNDLSNTTWSESEILHWVNDGQRTIVTRLPQAYPVRAVFALDPADGILQPLPGNAFRLIKITRNMGVNGTTSGRVIRPINENQLYNVDKDWTSAPPEPEIKHYSYDPSTPAFVTVFPPPSEAVQVESWVSTMPPDVTTADSPIVLDDSFFTPLVDYVLARCYQKNMNVDGAPQRVTGYLGSFEGQVANRDAGDRRVLANTTPTRMAGDPLK